MTFKLHPETQIGAVSLNIRDMQTSLDFYTERLGFQIHKQEEQTAYLGVGDADLLILHETPTAPSIEASAGLYHFAILVPSRLDLAKSLYRLSETQTSIQGASDHLVSEALYLADPDGVGIEIYRDRPRDEWTQTLDGVQMDILPLDLQGMLGELTPSDTQWQGLPAGTTIGHVHLHTGQNTDLSKRFYTEQLGLDVMLSLGGYWHFVAAGGYHHHIGLRPAGTRQNQASIGLYWYALDFPNALARKDAVAHLRSVGVDVTETDTGYHLYDHANNGIMLTHR
jgi:catechol 2,3-dioxygenase